MKTYNFAPGPTPVPHRVTVAMTDQPLNHRSSDYSKLLLEASNHLKYLFQTSNDVLTFTASGTGAMEAAVASLLSPGDRAVVVRGGKFGGRWVEICEAYGIEPVVVEVVWGHAVDPDEVADRLRHEKQIKALFATHSETSTGVLHDIEALGRIIKDRDDILFIVDAISGLGANDLRTDEWGVDVVVSGSQKGLMLPPGLAFASVSSKAWAAAARSCSPNYYLSFKRARASLAKGANPYTPAVTLVAGLAEALRQIKAMGLQAILEHHARLASAARAGAAALGLDLFARQPSNVLTAVAMPDDMDATPLLKHIKSCYGVTIANGMEPLKGRYIRIAHLGYDTSVFDVVTAISALEMGLARFGHPFEPGAGVAAVQRSLMMQDRIDGHDGAKAEQEAVEVAR